MASQTLTACENAVDLSQLGRTLGEVFSKQSTFCDGKEELQNFVDHFPDGVALLNEDMRLIMANRAAQDYLPRLCDAKEGQVISQVGPHPIRDLPKRSEEGSPVRIQLNGQEARTFEVELREMAKPSGAWILLIREVTLEEELRVRAQLQAKLAAVGQLSAGIAHDFNNMLTVIMGFAELLGMRADVPETAKERLKMIVSQGHRGEQLIRQILDFSRQTSVQRRPVDLVPFLGEAVKLLERTLPETIEVVSEVRGGESIVNANLTQLQQVITNVAFNARDAMPGGGLRFELAHLNLEPGNTLKIRTYSTPIVPEVGPGDWVVLTVSDTGEGMSSDVMSRIFEPFYTTKKTGEGTGLGLSQVYGIVKQHGGYIDVDSVMGKGTTLRIYLPRITEKAASPSEDIDEDLSEGQGETILLVEDQDIVAEVIKAMLEDLNYRVLTAPDGSKALLTLDDHEDEIDLVLSDVVMPNMGGLELAESLVAKSPEIPIVLMTGYKVGEKEGVSFPAEIEAYLEKPVGLLKLSRVISRALKSRKAQRPA